MVSRVRVQAILFALIMLVSMPAMGASAFGGPGAPAADGASPTAEQVEESIEQTDIADELREQEGTVEAVVRFDRFDDAGTSSVGSAALRSHAMESQAEFRSFADSMSGVEVKEEFWIANALLVEFDTDEVSVDDLAAVEGVTQLHPNYEIELVDPVGDDAEGLPAEDADVAPEGGHYTYGLEQVNAPDVWDEFGVRGEGTSVAVLDTGVDPDHPDIDIDPENFQEFDSDGNEVDSDPRDTNGHGTHVSGTVVGGDASGTHIGVAPNAELMHGLILPGGSGSFAQIIGGIEWAVDEDADVISMSLGAPGQEPVMIEPIENAVDAGTLVIASAGNDGDGATSTPGNLYSTLNLGATDESENVATFSSGDVIDTESDWDGQAPDYWPDEYVVPDISAPGVDVKSAQIGGGYTELSGTSMSAPHAAGTAALMITAAGGELEPFEVHDVMEEHAVKPDDWDEPDDEPDTRYGFGIIDAHESVAAVESDSGIDGTVTDADTGDAVPGVDVHTDSGLAAITDDDGFYTLYAVPGEYEVQADAFAYEPSDDVTVEVPDNETFVDQPFELDPTFDVALEAGQPEELLSGDAFTVEVRAGHVEAVTVENVGDFDDAHATLHIGGEQVAFGETHEFDDRVYGPLEVTVETDAGHGGEIELEHVFEGLGDSATVTTGPTNVVADPFDVAVVATEEDDAASDFAASLTATDALIGDPGVITPDEAIDTVDEYDALVVHSLNDDIEGLDNANELFETARAERVGTVVLDQQGSGANAKSVLSEARGYPDVVDYPGTLIIGAPSWYAGIENPDHAFWDDVQFDDITTLPPDFIRYDETEWSTTHYAGFDGETEALAGQFFTPSGPSVGIDEPRGVTLFGSMGYAGPIGSGDYEDDAYRSIANAVLYNTEVDDTSAFITEEPAMRQDPGETIESVFEVENLERVKTEVTDDTTFDTADLTLHHGSQVNAFGEWRAFDPPRDDDAFDIRVDTPADETGIVELEHTLRVEHDDGSMQEFSLTTRTSVFEPPLHVPEDADTIDEAIDMSVPHTEVVIADGTYEEQLVVPFDAPGYNLTIRGEEGATPTIQAPDDLGPDNGVLEIQQRYTTVENLHIEGHQFVDEDEIEPGDYPFDPRTDPVVETEEDALDELQWGIVAGVTGGEIPTDHTTIRDVEVSGVDVGIQFGGLLAGSDSNFNVVDNATITDTSYVGAVAGTPPDEAFITDASNTTIRNSHVEGPAIGIMGDSRQSDYVTIENNTIEDVWFGAGQDGNNRGTIVDNHVHDAEVAGVWNQGGQRGIYEGNTVEDAEYGVALGGDWGLNGYRVIQIRHNEFVDTETGVFTGNHDWIASLPHPVWIHYNEFEGTDVDIHNEREGDAMSNVDARLNWFGPDGDATIVHDPAENEALYDPHLTAPSDEVDHEDTRQFATALEFDGGSEYAVGVPGPATGTVAETFTDDFEGVVFGFDAETQSWTHLSENDTLGPLDGLYVDTEEDITAQMSFYHGENATPSPGQASIQEGWNFVGASQLTGIEDAYGVTSADPTLGLGVFDRPHSPLAAQQGELAGTYVFGDDEHGPTVSPFEGAFIYTESDGLVPSHLTHNPSVDQLHDQLSIEPRHDVDPVFNDPGAAPWGVADDAAFAPDADLSGADAEEAVESAALKAIRAHNPDEALYLESASVARQAALEKAEVLGMPEAEAKSIARDATLDAFGGVNPENVRTDLVTLDAIEDETVTLDESAATDDDSVSVADDVTPALAGERDLDPLDERLATTDDDAVQVAMVDGANLREFGDDDEILDFIDDIEAELDDADEFEFTPIAGDELFDEMGLEEAESQFDVFVVNSFGLLWIGDAVDEEDVADFDEMASAADVGVVYLNNGQPLGIDELNRATDHPGTVDSWGVGSGDPIHYEVADHELFEGMGDPGETIQIHETDWISDYDWFDDYDGEIVGHTTDGDDIQPGVGLNVERQEVLVSSTARYDFSLYHDGFNEEVNPLVANAVEWTADDIVDPVSSPAAQIEPGDDAAWELETPPVEQIRVDVHEDSTVDADDLTLHLDGSVNAFGEWRAYESPREGTFPFHVTTTEETVGELVLEVDVDVTALDEPFTFVTSPTAVYDPPLTVGDSADATVDTVQEGVDLAPDDGRTVHVESGTYEESVHVTTGALTLTPVDDADVTLAAPDHADDGAVLTVEATDVEVSGLHVDGQTDTGVVHGLAAHDAHGLTVTDASVTHADTAVGAHGTADATVTGLTADDIGTAVAVDHGDDPHIADLDATAVDRGISLAETSGATVTEVTVADVADEAIHAADAHETAVTDLHVEDAGTGVMAAGSHVHLEDATLDGVDTGAEFVETEGILTETMVAGDTGFVLEDAADEDLFVHFNDLSATDTGVHSATDETIDARLNHLGHGTAETAIQGDVAHQPFLTTLPSEIDGGVDTDDIGVEATIEAGGMYGLGVPGHTTQQLDEVFEDDFEGAVYGFDADAEGWELLTGEDELSALDGLAVAAESDGTAVMEFRDDGPAQPGTIELTEGWNFVGSPLHADVETAYAVGSANSDFAMYFFDRPETQFGPAGELDGSYVFGTDPTPPTVGAFEAQFLFVDEAGSVPSYLHSDPTMTDLHALLNVEPTVGDDETQTVDDIAAEPPASLVVVSDVGADSVDTDDTDDTDDAERNDVTGLSVGGAAGVPT